MMFQCQPDRPAKSVRYWSPSMNKPEQAFKTTHRDYLTVIWTILSLRMYLKVSQFIISMEHTGLRWISSMTDATEKLCSMRLRFLELEFNVVH